MHQLDAILIRDPILIEFAPPEVAILVQVNINDDATIFIGDNLDVGMILCQKFKEFFHPIFFFP